MLRSYQSVYIFPCMLFLHRKEATQLLQKLRRVRSYRDTNLWLTPGLCPLIYLYILQPVTTAMESGLCKNRPVQNTHGVMGWDMKCWSTELYNEEIVAKIRIKNTQEKQNKRKNSPRVFMSSMP